MTAPDCDLLPSSDRFNSRSATFADFPTEILGQIVVYLDDSSLLDVAKLGCGLNRVGLNELFRRHKTFQSDCISIRRPAYRDASLPLPHGDTMTILRALCSAIWVKRVPSLTVYLSPIIPYLFDEIPVLTIFVDQLDWLRSVDLCIGFGSWSDSTFPSRARRVAHGQHWGKTLGAFLDLVQSKGCSELSVREFEPIGQRIEMNRGSDPSPYSSHPDAPVWGFMQPTNWFREKLEKLKRSFPSRGHDVESVELPPGHKNVKIRQWLPSMIARSVRKRGEYILVLPLRPQPGLSAISMTSVSLLAPLFFSKTIDISQTHASTIRALTLNYYLRDQERWKGLLQQLQLPNLECLSCRQFENYNWPQMGGSPEALLAFAARHSTITKLNFHSMPQLHERSNNIPILPNLQSLACHATAAAYLLQVPENCRLLHFLELLSSAPSSHNDAAAKDLHECFDSALSSINTFGARALCLSVEFCYMYDAAGWIRAHTKRGAESIERGLTRVYSVALEPVSLVAGPSRRTFWEVLPDWLGLFPGLQMIHVDTCDTTWPGFNKTVTTRCPHLLKISIGLKHFPHSPSVLFDE